MAQCLRYCATNRKVAGSIPDSLHGSLRNHEGNIDVEYIMEVLLSTLPAPPTMRIEKQWPNAEWNVIWRNIHASPVNVTTKVTWYKAIHDILPTRTRLNNIRLAPTALCERCDQEDAVKHQLIECNGGLYIWIWTCQRLTMILRTDWRRIPTDWLQTLAAETQKGGLMDTS
jgi:hypothetical protein